MKQIRGQELIFAAKFNSFVDSNKYRIIEIQKKSKWIELFRPAYNMYMYMYMRDVCACHVVYI